MVHQHRQQAIHLHQNYWPLKRHHAAVHKPPSLLNNGGLGVSQMRVAHHWDLLTRGWLDPWPMSGPLGATRMICPPTCSLMKGCWRSKAPSNAELSKSQYPAAFGSNVERRGQGQRTASLPIRAGKKPTASDKLQDRVTEAERQLKVEIINKQTDMQTLRISPLRMVAKAMISSGAQHVPKFSSRRPEELSRFLWMMEDLWKDAEVNDDGEMKEMVRKYADQDTEEEWKALENYKHGKIWEEFKTELIANYPEATAAEQGTPARIRWLCKEMKRIQLGDPTTLYTF